MNKNIESGNTYKIIVFALTYGISFYYLKLFSKQNSWLIVILANIIGFLFIKMILKIKESLPNKSIFEINKHFLGNKLGKIANIIFSIVNILITIIMLWYLTVFLKTNFLEKTPILIIELVLILPLLYISNKNSLLIIKSSYIFSFIIIILTIISIVFLIPQVELNNFKPFIEITSVNMFKALFFFTTVTYLPTYGIIGINDLKTKKIFKNSLETFLLTISIVLMTYLVLGNSIVEIVDFPEFFVLRKIGIFANGTRIDSLIITGWILSVYITNATNLLYVRNYLMTEIKSYHNYYMYLVIIITGLMSTKIFNNVSVGKNFILNSLPYILFLTIFLLNFIIFVIIKVKHKNVSHKY